MTSGQLWSSKARYPLVKEGEMKAETTLIRRLASRESDKLIVLELRGEERCIRTGHVKSNHSWGE
jgi:hypothetical protein